MGDEGIKDERREWRVTSVQQGRLKYIRGKEIEEEEMRREENIGEEKRRGEERRGGEMKREEVE